MAPPAHAEEWQPGRPLLDYEHIEAVIRTRRTTLAVDPGRGVPATLVHQFCDLARCAPNRKRTSPWRFAMVTDAGRDRLGEVIAAALDATGEPAQRGTKALNEVPPGARSRGRRLSSWGLKTAKWGES